MGTDGVTYCYNLVFFEYSAIRTIHPGVREAPCPFPRGPRTIALAIPNRTNLAVGSPWSSMLRVAAPWPEAILDRDSARRRSERRGPAARQPRGLRHGSLGACGTAASGPCGGVV